MSKKSDQPVYEPWPSDDIVVTPEGDPPLTFGQCRTALARASRRAAAALAVARMWSRVGPLPAGVTPGESGLPVVSLDTGLNDEPTFPMEIGALPDDALLHFARGVVIRAKAHAVEQLAAAEEAALLLQAAIKAYDDQQKAPEPSA